MRGILRAREEARRRSASLPFPGLPDLALWLGIAGAYIAIGGAAAMWGHVIPGLSEPTKPEYAVVYGVGAEGLWASLIRGSTE
jgi:hypothetical protein